MHNDATLIRTKRKIPQMFACLPTPNSFPRGEPKNCKIMGWGTTLPSQGGYLQQTRPSNVLNSADVTLIDFGECSGKILILRL